MKIFGLAGWSGSGKTTLMVKLLPELIGRGLTVSTMKHAHHSFDVDKPGKDSHSHRTAGAKEVLLTSSRRWALMHELGNDQEPSVEELIDHITPVDLLLIEGFKTYNHDKLLVHRGANRGEPALAMEDPTVVALASDATVADAPVPVFHLDAVRDIADFIIQHCRLEKAGQ